MMTIDEARANIGRGVVYVPKHGRREDGVIMSVSGDRYVMVQYAGQAPAQAKATYPRDLELLTVGGSS